MKTRILLCLLLMTGLSQLYAQFPVQLSPPKNGNGNVTFTYVWDEYWQPITCGDFNDALTGIVNCYFVVHFKNGLPVFANEHVNGTVCSSMTGENFKLNEKDKIEVTGSDYSFAKWHFNLIGDQGTHYIGSMIWNCLTGEMWFDKLICVEK